MKRTAEAYARASTALTTTRRTGIVMAIHTLPLSHRDLNQTELAELEVLIDAAGIEAVIQSLSEICGLKADHIAATVIKLRERLAS
jgi:hypothetical protein